MLRINLHYLKDLIQKNLLWIGIIIILIVILTYLSFLLFLAKQKIEDLEKEVLALKSLPTPACQAPLTPKEKSAGQIGEIPEKEIRLPVSIFNTTGEIREIKKDRVLVWGSGTNFADQKPRELTLIFTKATLVFKQGQKKFYQGLEGLKYLKPGMKILIEGDENIRGKTQFKVRTINILSQ